MQKFALAREIVGLATLAVAVSYSGLAQDAAPTNWTLDLIRATALSPVTTVPIEGRAMIGTAQIDGGCSPQYLILRISLLGRTLQFDSSSGILLSVDGRQRQARLYDADDGEHKNKAREIFFVNGSAKQGLAGIGGIGSNGGTGSAAIQHNVDALFNNMMKIGMAGRSAGTLVEAYQATSIQLQLPLSSGPLWIEIRPEDYPSFRQFKTRCFSPDKDSSPPLFAAGPSAPDTAPSGQLSASKQFHGTVDAFLDALPGFVQRAAQQVGVDSRAYESDTAAMKEMIRTCAAITPDMIRSVKDRFGLVRLMNLPAQYKPCAAGQNAKASFSSAAIRPLNSSIERSIEMYIHNLEGRLAPFTVSVNFTDLPNDQALDLATTIFNSPKYIVMGTIR